MEANTEQATTPDLEKIRDDKCEPIARAMFAGIAEDLFSEETTQVDLTKKLLSRSLTEDLEISTEVSYIFQLMLGMLSGLNRTMYAISQEVYPVDNKRYGLIATRILKILSDAKVKMTNVKPEDTATDFAEVKASLLTIFQEENLNGLEIRYIIQELIFAEFTSVNNLYSKSLEASSERAEAKLFGIESMDRLTLKKLNEVLLSETPKPSEETKVEETKVEETKVEEAPAPVADEAQKSEAVA